MPPHGWIGPRVLVVVRYRLVCSLDLVAITFLPTVQKFARSRLATRGLAR
jgi:hypothetical protein